MSIIAIIDKNFLKASEIADPDNSKSTICGNVSCDTYEFEEDSTQCVEIK